MGARDTTFSLFHVIGKFCYHKREEGSLVPNPNVLLEYQRDSLDINPEAVLKTVHIPPWTFNQFVHENYLGFYNDIHEVAQAAEYFSDADILDSQLNYPYRVSFILFPAIII